MSYVESRLICGFGAGRSGTVHFRHALDGPRALLPAPTPFPQGAAVSSVGSWGCRCVHAMDSGGFLFGGDQKLLKEEQPFVTPVKVSVGGDSPAGTDQ